MFCPNHLKPYVFWNILEFAGFSCVKSNGFFGFLSERWSRFRNPTGCLPSNHKTNQTRTLSKKPFKVSCMESFEECHTSETHFNQKHLSLAYSKVEMYRHFESGCSKNFTWYLVSICFFSPDQQEVLFWVLGSSVAAIFGVLYVVFSITLRLKKDEPNLTNMFPNFRLVSQPPTGGHVVVVSFLEDL